MSSPTEMIPQFTDLRTFLLHIATILGVEDEVKLVEITEWRKALGKYCNSVDNLKTLVTQSDSWQNIKLDEMVKAQIKATLIPSEAQKDKEIAELKETIAHLNEISALNIPSQSGKAIIEYPPASFELQLNINEKICQKTWNNIKQNINVNVKVNREGDLMDPLDSILSQITKYYWKDPGGDKNDTTTVPDFIISCLGDNWDCRKPSDRRLVLIDIDIKRHFNPKQAYSSASAPYPGDTRKAYRQLLERATEAFKQQYKGPYYFIMTDLQSIVFWRVEFNNGLKAYHDGPYPFGGSFADNTIKYPSSKKTPLGFQKFVSLIHSRLNEQGTDA